MSGVYRKRPHPPPQQVSRVSFLAGGDDLAAAAEIIARVARRMSGSWSVSVPPSISVSVSGRVATIEASAPPARPAELRLRHPLFGDRDHWYGPPGRPFLAPAADGRIDAAAKRWAEKIDKMARKAGWQ